MMAVTVLHPLYTGRSRTSLMMTGMESSTIAQLCNEKKARLYGLSFSHFFWTFAIVQALHEVI